MPATPIEFRPLRPADADTVDQFRVGMGGLLDWRIDDPQHWPYVIGHFAQERLIAAAAVCNWGDVIAETYVDTLPEFRGQGLATALTYEITRWIVEETSWIAQAGGEVVNTPSGRIARRLGYVFYGYLFMNNLARQS
ncbi:MAG: GNAT family N-acetyltransferase [Anaerolinea sp.]|nr:GNAT family N-acetyltransferase [Anaerolinea sp.]